MMNTSDILAANGYYSKTDEAFFEANSGLQKFTKGELLLAPGKNPLSFRFVVSGAVYQFRYKNELDENVIDFHTPGEWYFAEHPTRAFYDTEIIELEFSALHWLMQLSPSFLQLGKIPGQATNRLLFFDNQLTAAQKYQHVLEHRPELLQLFPLKMIAAYLKISPETMSRVREHLSIKNRAV